MGVEVTTQQLPIGFGRGRRSNTIAILIGSATTYFQRHSRVLEWGPEEGLSAWELTAANGYLMGLTQAGFHPLWRQWAVGESPEEVAAALLGHDAVIAPALHDVHLPVLDLLLEAGVPVVLAYSRSPDPRVAWVACDNHGGIVRTVRHLTRLGRRRIGYLAGPRTVLDFREREQGYYDGMLRAGLTVRSEWVLETSVSREAPEIKAAAEQLLRPQDRPEAVICAADPLALGVLQTARELGLRVPEDVAVTGFDDIPEALQVIPRLTSVRQPTLEIANRACYLAACCVLGQQPAFGTWQLDLPTTLLVRDSCGGAPALPIGAGEKARPEPSPLTMRQELEWRLRQLSAMNEEMQELLYVASHDLRAPLVTIQGFAHTLQRKYAGQLDEQGQHYLSRIGRSVDSLRGLIDSLLTLSRAHNQPLDLDLISTREVVLRVVADLDALIRKRNARVRIPRRLPTVLADEVALYQVFLNLIGNALKYLGDQPAPLVSVSSQVLPEEYEFTVRDNGIGIPPEHHEEVFQAFRRLRQTEAEGAGIGLSTVKRIILRHGGRIWVDSQLGRGAAFRFTLPRREGSGPALTGLTGCSTGLLYTPR